MLLAAVRHADFLIADEARKLRKRRFQYTAKHLSELKPSTNYSAKACRKRYRDLMNDRAKIPPELDDEPEKRADEKAARILRHLEKQATQRAADLEAQERAKVEEEGQQMQLVQRQLAVAERKEAEEAERMARIQEAMEKKQKKIDDINRKKTDRQNRMALLNRQSEKRQSVIQKQREAGATFNAAAAAQAKAQADADRKKNIARMIMVQRQSATPARSTRASTATPSRRGRGRGGAGARGKGGKKSGKVAENEKATPAAEAFKSADFVEGSDDDAANAEPDAAIAEMNLEVEANDMDEELYGEPSELPSAGKDTAYATPTSVGKFHLGALSSSNKAPTASPSSSRASSVSPRNDSSPAVAGSPLNTPIPPKAAAPRVLRSASKKPSPLSKATSANGVKFQEASTAAANKTGKGGKGGVKRASNDDDEEMLDDVDVGGASQAET